MKIFQFLGIIMMASLIISCGEDEPTKVISSLQLTVGNEPLALDKTYEINDVNVQFQTAAMYIGDVEFQLNDKTFKREDTRYYLLKTEALNFLLGEVDAKSFDRVKFNIGLDAETNALDEEDYNSRPAGDPLGVQDPSMHWSWDAGYRFIRLDGKADLDNNGDFESTLTYHIGKDAFYASIDKAVSVDLEEGDNWFNIHVDVAKVLAGVDFNKDSDRVTHTANNLPLATKVFENLSSAVSIEKQ